jgi:Na+/serine symporter
MIIAVVTVVERLADVLVSWYVKFLNPQLALSLVSNRISDQKSSKLRQMCYGYCTLIQCMCCVSHVSKKYIVFLEVRGSQHERKYLFVYSAHNSHVFQKIPKSCLFGRKLQ